MSALSKPFHFNNSVGEELVGRLELPATPPGRGDPQHFAVFAHCFTCSKNIAAASRISRALCDHGIAVLRFDFTGLGNSAGDFANSNFSSNVEDITAAADALRERYRAPQLLVGHSLGGAAVLAAATTVPEVRAIATIGAPSEPQHVEHLFADARAQIEREGAAEVNLGGRTFTIKKQFLEDVTETRLSERLAELKRALIIFHSPTDNIVGIDQARRIYQAAKHPKSFVSLDGADHLLSSAPDAEYVAAVLAAWGARYLSSAEPAAPAAELDAGEVRVTELSGYTQEVSAGRHHLRADEPASVGGADEGPTPYDLLLAGLGACTTMTLRMYANRKQWPLTRASVTLRHRRIHAKDCTECETEQGFIDRIDRVVEIEGAELDEEQRARLLEIADKCPVHRTLSTETVIHTEGRFL